MLLENQKQFYVRDLRDIISYHASRIEHLHGREALASGRSNDAIDNAPSGRFAPSPLSIRQGSYPQGHIELRHQHSHARFLRSISGLVFVLTSEGVWLVPADHGLLIPAGAEHHVSMMSNSLLQIVNIDSWVATGLGENYHLVAVSSLLNNLISAVPDQLIQSNGRDHTLAKLFLHEIEFCPRLPLWLPLPSDEVLWGPCADFLLQPNIKKTRETLSSSQHMSRRLFARKFKTETGLSWFDWRKRACLITAVSRLAEGETVGTVASLLGFGRSAAFAAMFKRWLGSTPKVFRPKAKRSGY